MVRRSHARVYDTIGCSYTARRKPDPRIASAIHAALGDARTVCNIGAGTGAYEPAERIVTAVEPSQVMIAQRTSDVPVVCATAEELPFDDQQFDAAMAILTVHHWENPSQGLAEMKRISRRQVVFMFDPNLQDSLWLVRDYLPEIAAFESQRALPVETVAKSLGSASIEPVEIPHDCTDGFQAAYWRRPEMYLRDDVQATISTLAQLPASTVSAAMQRLREDIDSGVWHRRYGDLLAKEAHDFGYRILVADQNS